MCINKGLVVIPDISKNKDSSERDSLKVIVNSRQPRVSFVSGDCEISIEYSTHDKDSASCSAVPIMKYSLLHPVHWLQHPLPGTAFLNLLLLT